MDFKNGTESIQKVKVLSYVRTGENTKLDKISITYTRTDGAGNGATLTASKFSSDFSNEEKTLLKNAVAGTDNGEVSLTKVFEKKDGAEQGYWNLKTIKPVGTFIAKESKPSYNNTNKKTYTSVNTNTSTRSGGGYNEAGVKAGAAAHDAVALAIAQKGSKVTVLDVATIMRELLKISVKIESELRDGHFSEESTSATQVAQVKKEPIKMGGGFDSLEDLDSLDIEL